MSQMVHSNFCVNLTLDEYVNDTIWKQFGSIFLQ